MYGLVFAAIIALTLLAITAIFLVLFSGNPSHEKIRKMLDSIPIIKNLLHILPRVSLEK